MSVVQIKGATTSNAKDFLDFSSSSDSLFYVSNIVEDNLEEFSIELTLGNARSNNYSDQKKEMVEINSEISIVSQESIVVEVAEEIRVPHNRYGILVPTGGLFLTKGIMVAPAKVEPAFQGRLKLRIFNTSNRKVILRKGDKLASLVFFSTETTKYHDAKYRVADVAKESPVRFGELRKWFSQNRNVWLNWLFMLIFGPVSAAFVVHYFMKPNGNGESSQQKVEMGTKAEIKEHKRDNN